VARSFDSIAEGESPIFCFPVFYVSLASQLYLVSIFGDGYAEGKTAGVRRGMVEREKWKVESGTASSSFKF